MSGVPPAEGALPDAPTDAAGAPPETLAPMETGAQAEVAAPASSVALQTSQTAGGRGMPIGLPLAMLAAGLLLSLLAYLVVTIPGAWFPSVRSQAWSARELGVTRGAAVVEGPFVTVTPSDASGTLIVTVRTPFKAADYPLIAWEAFNVPSRAEVRLLWRNSYTPSRLNSASVPVSTGRLLPVTLADDPNWMGTITGLALAIQQDTPAPVRIAGVVARTMGLADVLRDRFGEWLRLEPWAARSINTIFGGADAQDVPLPIWLAVGVLVAAGLLVALGRFRHRLAGVPAALGIVFLGAWMLSDLRWSYNLARQSTLTVAQLAPKDAQARRLAGDDGRLYAFIERVKAKLPVPPARVFMAADATYQRGRGAYHLYPHNVYFDPRATTMPPPERMRPGDFIVVWQRRGIQFDAANSRLRWDGQAPVAAELLLLEPGAALFRLM